MSLDGSKTNGGTDQPRKSRSAAAKAGIVAGLLAVFVAIGLFVAYLVTPWPPWPHVHRGDLVALVARAPQVPGGRLYWEDRMETGCTWTDCPEARLQRRYLIPCDQTETFAARLGRELESLGFPRSRRLVFFDGSSNEWDAGFVAADVTHGKIWADYSTSQGAEVPKSMYPDVSYSEVKSGCTIVWTLSVSDPRPND